ncbi:unnamed protein product [Linum tenue]|uniref:Activator of Hsp90 ATPase AHSA1-like N-terminal domain-containing protein n=1 Tax=Linum tenue TaxID=586396 RepID=A0AAV0S4Y9_9ROSI|nr:unnamed protein product [Linum tenue]
MENGDLRKEETQQGSSYTYWVREATADAAPVPVPKKLSVEDVVSSQPKSTALGSVWNRAGTWEEKNLNKWASERIKELLTSVGTLDFSGGKAEIKAVSKCSGDFEVRLSDTKDISQQNKQRINRDVKSFLEPVREKLLQFEQELKDR